MIANTPRDYLKYWKVIRTYYKAKFGLTQASLEMLLFLYSEKYFSVDRFAEYNRLLGWNKLRFQDLMRDGWIESFRPHGRHKKAIYKISDKARDMVSDLYRKLNGEDLPVHKTNNPIFKVKAPHWQKIHRDMVMQLNEVNKQRRRLPHEL